MKFLNRRIAEIDHSPVTVDLNTEELVLQRTADIPTPALPSHLATVIQAYREYRRRVFPIAQMGRKWT